MKNELEARPSWKMFIGVSIFCLLGCIAWLGLHRVASGWSDGAGAGRFRFLQNILPIFLLPAIASAFLPLLRRKVALSLLGAASVLYLGLLIASSQGVNIPQLVFGAALLVPFWALLTTVEKKTRRQSVLLPFQVGDKVYDTWNKIHTVMAIDSKAEHGMGVIRTQRDSDGVKLGHAVIGHDLTTSLKPHPSPSEEPSP